VAPIRRAPNDTPGAEPPAPPIERASIAERASVGTGWRSTCRGDAPGAGLPDETLAEPEPVREAAAACAGVAG